MTGPIVRQENSDRYMAEVSRHPVLSRAAEQSLARRFFDHGDVRAAHQLVVANLRFVVKVAHEYRGYGLKLLDLIQEGNIGLMVAVKKFDPYKGYRLISYAVWWVRAYMQSYIMRSWSLVRLGAGRAARKLFFKLRSERSRAEKEGRTDHVSTREMAERLAVGEADVLDMELRLAAKDFSLDQTIGEDGGALTHLDMLQGAEPSQEDSLVQQQQAGIVRAQVARAMATLSDKERYIVNKRMMTDEPLTLQEIGDRLKVSRERVRQLESRVKLKLRRLVAPALGREEPGSATA
ncbi:MAG: sigma-70 family RNA polymerase sigma factor [Deltaproteobacteria bacterium]|nr:MAG: sigma-70 family RNA polymerase sigma factor [Deltaproteobacteria bacterium]